jgi:hypothetical protein
LPSDQAGSLVTRPLLPAALIVQLTATASRAGPTGRRTRSATPALDPATTHKDTALASNTGRY